MPIATHALTGNFNAILGEVKALRVVIRTNSEDAGWVNDTDNFIALGGTEILSTVSGPSDGTFSIALPTSTGTGLQYEVTAEFSDPGYVPGPKRMTWSSGWFDLTANADLADKANDSSLRVNPSQAAILGGRIDDNEERLDALEAGGGTEILAAQMFGRTNHGNVSGSVTFNGPTASHRFTATAPTTITLADYTDGMVATLICFSGAEGVTVVDAGEVELVDNTAWSAELVEDVWISGGGGGTPAVPDTTPPTAVTGLMATGGEGQVSATWSAATDAESAVHYRWRVWLTSSGASGEWTNTDALSFTKTGLAAGAYTVQVYAYSGGGASATASATATATAPAGWNAFIVDSFTGPDGTLTAHTPDTGTSSPWRSGAAWQQPSGSTVAGWSITGNKLTQDEAGYNPQNSLPIGSGSRAGIGVSVNYSLATQSDSTSPVFNLAFGDMAVQVSLSSGMSANNGGGHGEITLTGTTTLPTSGKLSVRMIGTALTILLNDVHIATGTTFQSHNNEPFLGLYLSGFKSSTIDNFTAEEYVS